MQLMMMPDMDLVQVQTNRDIKFSERTEASIDRSSRPVQFFFQLQPRKSLLPGYTHDQTRKNLPLKALLFLFLRKQSYVVV